MQEIIYNGNKNFIISYYNKLKFLNKKIKK